MYEPCNWAGSVTGANSVVCSYEKFQPSQPAVECKVAFFVCDYCSFVDSCNFTNKANLHAFELERNTRQKLCHFGHCIAKVKP